jgi:hypothetical protein
MSEGQGDQVVTGRGRADAQSQAPGSRPRPAERLRESYAVPASTLSSSGVAVPAFARDGFVLIGSGSAPGSDVADAAAFRKAAVYWFQYTLHILPRPSFWLGWTGKSATGASWASISKRAEPMHLRRSVMSVVLSLAVAHLATCST